MRVSRFTRRPFLIIASALFAAVLTSCTTDEEVHRQTPQDLPPIEVSVATAETIKPPRQTQVMATVEAAQSASIAARISGNITDLPVKLGSRVKKGDTLAVISADEIKAQVNQARAQLDQVRRNLKREQSLLKKNAATPESVK
ncbi:MAG: biotin/lipoyl-binding protein, partial [Desulfofustis sp.]